MPAETKTVKVKVALHIWEAFYKLFPGKGERSAFLRQVIQMALELEAEKDGFIRRIKEELREGPYDGDNKD